MSNTLSNADRRLDNSRRRWNNVWREQAAGYLKLAKRAKREGNTKVALLAMQGYHRCMASIRE